ncbi:acid phosphatase type 7-like [Liolophura sinensis]|uniref:acid phosphatase type 7-like n=1 Tax=Liolophura sinensis TaxID=3198878 RepID=UPI00315936FE
MAAFLVCMTLMTLSVVTAQYFGQPEQVHLSFGGSPSEMIVTWSTMSTTNQSVVEFGLKGRPMFTHRASGYQTKFTDGGTLHRIQYIHRVTLTGLEPGNSYVYHCGSPEAGWSDIHTFTAMKSGTDWSPSIVLYGDLGNSNPQSIPRLQEDVAKGMYDAVFHVGDFAYDMLTDNAQVGDEFMRQIEPIAGNLPYMTCPGNHENGYNFSNYRNRFTMPGDEDGRKMFYSFNIGPVHVISFSTEFYFYIQYGIHQIFDQYVWLEEDLKEAAKPENRAERPWIITMAHRPMYCSNYDNDDCTKSESIIRTGLPITQSAALEPLLYKYGVDLEFWAHEHSYERLFPIYNRVMYNGSWDFPYTNPRAPVHIITGSAGCYSRHDPFKSKFASWSAFHSLDYGYTRMKVINKTHIYLEQVSDDKGGAIIDSMTLIKDSHQAYRSFPQDKWFDVKSN